MKVLLTSCSNLGISLVVSASDVVLNKLPSAILFKDTFVLLYDEDKKEIERIQVTSGGTTRLSLSSLPEGLYYFCLYFRLPDKQGIYYPFFKFGDVPILIHGKSVELLDSLVLENNVKFSNSLNSFSKYDRRVLTPTYHIQVNNLNIRKLASQIANGLYEKMSIIRAVHSWVALNISYDYDSLIDDAHIDKDNTALGAYVGRKCVCRGYTNLCIALLRALHIPAIKIYCCALDIAHDGSWRKQIVQILQ